MTRKKLGKDDLELWRQVAHTTKRLHPDKKSLPTAAPTSSKKASSPHKSPVPQPTNPKPTFRTGQQAQDKVRGGYSFVTDIADQLRAEPLRMDRKIQTRLRRGQMRPEMRIDLHGLTLDQAHPALTGFILKAYAQQKRLVLVITGKGRKFDDTDPIPQRRGLLRHNVPDWLKTPPLNSVVIQISPAHQRHGGDGAYYVYLKRQR